MPPDMNPPSEPFKAIWLNINGINSNKTNSSFHLLIRLFVQSSYSIMFLQEPRLKEAKAGQLENACNWPNSKVQGHFTSNQKGNGGVATIVKKSFLGVAKGFVVHELALDECQHVTFSIEGTQFSFANVYMSSHSGAKRAALCKQLQLLPPPGTIIGGDFNMVQDPALDMRRPLSVTTPYDNGGWQEMLDMQAHYDANGFT